MKLGNALWHPGVTSGLSYFQPRPPKRIYLGPKKVCKIMAFMGSIMGLGLFFYILLGFR